MSCRGTPAGRRSTSGRAAVTASLQFEDRGCAQNADDFIDFLQSKRGGVAAAANSQPAHPIMLAFGLWKNETDLDDLVDS